MLIETPEGVINTDHLVSAKPILMGADAGKSLISLPDGSRSVLSIGIEVLERACGVVVPAQPGFLVVEAVMPYPGDEEHGIFYRESPVVAFRVAGRNEGTVAITAEGEPTGGSDSPFVVQQPNGPCAGPDGWFEDIAAFKAQCETWLAARDKRNSAA